MFEPLPVKIEAHETKLLKARSEIANFIRFSEGLVFDKIGLDAIVGIIPMVDVIYTVVAGLWLLMQSNQVKSAWQDKFFIIILTIVDIAIGIFVGVGDVVDALFRVHAWNGNRLLSHIDYHLSLIAKTREQIEQGIDIDLVALEDLLFRGGKTQQELRNMYLAIGLLLILVFAGCTILVK
jgi:hypothetical protein